MAPFYRPYATFYWSAIVNIALSCTIYDLTLNNIVTLKSGLGQVKVIEVGAIRKLGCGFLFAFYSNYGRICSRLYLASKSGVTLKTGLGFVKVIGNGTI